MEAHKKKIEEASNTKAHKKKGKVHFSTLNYYDNPILTLELRNWTSHISN